MFLSVDFLFVTLEFHWLIEVADFGHGTKGVIVLDIFLLLNYTNSFVYSSLNQNFALSLHSKSNKDVRKCNYLMFIHYLILL